MKRSGPPKRKAELRADPEKTKAFVGRGRAAAARSLREERAREKRSDVVPPAQQRWHSEKPKRVQFRAKAPAHTQTCAWPGCDRKASSWHHWTLQQHIRIYVRGLRLPEGEERTRLAALLRDERNVSPFCSKHHGSHGTTSHEFTWSQVPPSAIEFAAELGDEYSARLRRAYPVTRVVRLPPQGAA